MADADALNNNLSVDGVEADTSGTGPTRYVMTVRKEAREHRSTVNFPSKGCSCTPHTPLLMLDCQVSDDSGHVWEISRRYSEFFMLRRLLLDILSVEHLCTGCCGT